MGWLYKTLNRFFNNCFVVKWRLSTKYVVVIGSRAKSTKQVEEVTSKSNSMLGFVRRTASNIHNIEVRRVLYLSLVRSKLGYASHVWPPQTVTDILKIERVQRCAIFLPFHTVQTHHTAQDCRLLVSSQSAIGMCI